MKKIFIILFSFLLVGCSANYTLTIDEDKYMETIQIIPSNTEESTMFNNNWKIPINYDIYSETDDSDNFDEFQNIDLYEYSNNGNSIDFKYNFVFNQIINSTALKKCFNSARIIRKDNRIIISTDAASVCFGDNENFDKLDINIIINNKNVITNNADRIIGNKYIWNIDRDNYLNKTINITFEEKNNSSSVSSSTSSISNNNNNFLSNISIDKNMLIFCLIFLVVVGFIILVYKRISKDDE